MENFLNTRHWLLLTAIGITTSVFGHDAMAQAPVTPSAGCLVAPARLSDDDINAFLVAPDKIFSGNTGVLNISNSVRGLLGSSASTLEPIGALVSNATPEQLSAIGSGMGRAARACTPVDNEYATRIQAKVVELNNPSLTTAFLAAVGDVQTASLGAPGGASAAAAGIGNGGTAGSGSGGLAGGNGLAQNELSGASTSGSSRYFSTTRTSSNVTNITIVLPGTDISSVTP